MQHETVLGIDVGASGLKGAIVDVSTGKLVSERHRVATPHPSTPEAIAHTFNKIVKHFNWKGPIGCGFPAVVINGMVKTAANIDASWVNIDAQDLFSKETGCPVLIFNDADVAGIAELYFGAGDGQSGMVIMITLGTGLGSVIIVDGVLVPNTELGHIYLENMDAEKYVSDGVRKKQDLSWPEFGFRLNKYLNHINFLFSPDMLILGGGGSKHFKHFSEYLDLKEKITTAQMLNEAGIIGAAYFAYCKTNGLTLRGVR